MTKKKTEPNPIETAIGNRAKNPKPLTTQKMKEGINQLKEQGVLPQNPSETPDVPSPSEMQTLEELNRKTVERLEDKYPEDEPQTGSTPQESITVPQETTTIPVSKPVLPPATKTSTPESPPQKIECFPALGTPEDQDREAQRQDSAPAEKNDKEFHPVGKPIPDIEKLPPDFKVKHTYETGIAGAKITPCDCPGNDDDSIIHICPPAEDIELTNLKKYILEDGFVVNTVAFHIVSLCAEPLMTPSTTMWDFRDRANIPDMVFALLNQPGYLEGIWPSLKIVMGSNAGNSAWSAGISTTIAFFDVVRTLPALKELQNETV